MIDAMSLAPPRPAAVLASEAAALLTSLAVLLASSLSLRRTTAATTTGGTVAASTRMGALARVRWLRPPFVAVAPAGLSPFLAAWLFLFAAPPLCRAVIDGRALDHVHPAASPSSGLVASRWRWLGGEVPAAGVSCAEEPQLSSELVAVRRQLEAAAAREARAAAVSAAHAELAAALQDELQEAQQHQAATEARLREMAAALKRLRDEPATTCAE